MARLTVLVAALALSGCCDIGSMRVLRENWVLVSGEFIEYVNKDDSLTESAKDVRRGLVEDTDKLFQLTIGRPTEETDG